MGKPPACYCIQYSRKPPLMEAAVLKFLVFSGQKLFCFFSGDLTGVALCHDLDILIVQLIEQVEDAGDSQTDGGDQGINDPQAVQSGGALLDVQGLELCKVGSLNADPTEQTQQEQGQGGGYRGGEFFVKAFVFEELYI